VNIYFSDKNEGVRPEGRCDMRLSRIITDYRLSKNEAFPLVKYIRQYVSIGPVIIFVLVLRKSTHF